MARKELRLVLGDQLNGRHSWFARPDANVTYVLMEVRQETDYVRHHVQKVAAFFAAMRRFAAALEKGGHRVVYIKLDDPDNTQSIPGNLTKLVTTGAYSAFSYQLPDEYRLDRQLHGFSEDLSIPWEAADTEHFLTGRHDVRDFFAGKKQFLMESFYRHMRRTHGVLLDGDKPLGGQWNFDRENRNRYDGAVPLMPPRLFRNDVSGIVRMLKQQGVATLGRIEPSALAWPLDRRQALIVLRHFIKRGLPWFGRYQDAMTVKSWSLFHSRLSFALNTKMLHPGEVIEAAVGALEERPGEIDLAQVEGFVRQVLGWREYMRGMYWAFMPGFADRNFFSHEAGLPGYFWDGDTRMNCVHQAVEQSLEHAYAHHIQRLMITGNFALLAGIHPAEVDAWYLGIYIDAVEWVELPNTRGMSQYADGGITASKPYVSSATYINKMSDYCKTCFYRKDERYGERACPFNSLYWEFLNRHRRKLQSNPRLGMVYRTWDKVDAGERRKILKQAKSYRGALEKL